MYTSTITTTDQYLSTPGEILKEEFMEPYGISNYRLAKALGISETAVGQIVNGKRAITVRTAFMLSKAFGTSPEFWLNLQRDYDVLRFDAGSVQHVPNLVEA